MVHLRQYYQGGPKFFDTETTYRRDFVPTLVLDTIVRHREILFKEIKKAKK